MGAECGGRWSPRPYLNSGMSFPSRHGTAARGASHSRAPIRLPQGLPRGASGFTPSQGRRGSPFLTSLLPGEPSAQLRLLAMGANIWTDSRRAGRSGGGRGEHPQPCSGALRVPTATRCPVVPGDHTDLQPLSPLTAATHIQPGRSWHTPGALWGGRSQGRPLASSDQLFFLPLGPRDFTRPDLHPWVGPAHLRLTVSLLRERRDWRAPPPILFPSHLALPRAGEGRRVL